MCSEFSVLTCLDTLLISMAISPPETPPPKKEKQKENHSQASALSVQSTPDTLPEKPITGFGNDQCNILNWNGSRGT